ncbi:MAG: hypothetical protein HYR78_07495 [Nitrospirae bacterium]|nr:hypothetical protein [Nitrospirota bacterium]
MSKPPMNRSLSWLLDDAIFLYKNGRKYGSILLLLCTVDALARETNPNAKVGERFEAFLKSKMRRKGRPQIHNISVPKFNQFFSFEYIIYKFLRCPLVHEGSRLEVDDPAEFAVRLDWDTIPNGLSVDTVNNCVILGGELVFKLLTDAVQHELQNS